MSGVPPSRSAAGADPRIAHSSNTTKGRDDDLQGPVPRGDRPQRLAVVKLVAGHALSALAVLVCTFSLSFSCGALRTWASPAEPPGDFVSWIDTQMKASRIPGASIAVVRDYHIQWAAGFGLADVNTGRRVTTDTPFQAASISKPIAAIVIIESLLDHGLSLNAAIPAITFSDASTWKLPNPYPDPVTVRELLSHTAGVVGFHYSGFAVGQQLPTMQEELEGTPPASTPPVTVVSKPGTVWTYAPGGYTVLQALAEQQNDWRPFHTLMRQYLLNKIPGLEFTTFSAQPEGALADAMAVPYLQDGSPLAGGPRVFNTEAAGAMVTTPTDLARILIAFQGALAGNPTGIPVSVARQMMVRQPGWMPAGHCLTTVEADADACKAPQGLGFDVSVDSTFVNHVGDDQPSSNWFGHSGFNSGYLSVLLGSKTGGNGVVVMINSAPADMTTSEVPQFNFIVSVIRRIAAAENW